MGCVARTARRRRLQAAQGYRHMSKMKRPKYHKVSAEKADNNLRRVIETQKRIQQGKNKKKK